MIKAISIDFWNTLVDARVNGEKRRSIRFEKTKKILNDAGLFISENDIDTAIKQGIREFEHQWQDNQKTIGAREMLTIAVDYLNVSLPEPGFEDLVSIFESGLLQGPPDLAPGVKTVIPQLAQTYSLGIISDTHFSPGSIIREYLKRQDLLHFFSVFAFSDEIGVSKPHPFMYKTIMDHDGCDPQEMIHIGDLQKTDIAGANALGVKSIYYYGLNPSDLEIHTADFQTGSWDEIPLILSRQNGSQ